jgi:hypothetical protein
MCLSLFLLPATGNCSFLQYLRTRWVRWISEQMRRWLPLFIQTGRCWKCVSSLGKANLSFWVVKTTLISLGDDFSICIIQLGFDQYELIPNILLSDLQNIFLFDPCTHIAKGSTCYKLSQHKQTWFHIINTCRWWTPTYSHNCWPISKTCVSDMLYRNIW